jgi:NTE family protein
VSRKPRTAFVLAGGGSLGAVQVGMLRALYERGLSADLVVGTSAGAINGAFIASRPQNVATAEELGELWRGVRRGQVFPLNPLTGLLGFLGNRDHLVPGSGLERLVSRHLDRTRLENMPLPLHVVAVDVVTGEELRLSHGPTLEAVLASAAIPAVLPPVSWGDRDLIDGGVANNTPISHAVELGADVVYVLPTGHACALEEPPRGALAMALHALSLLTHRRLIEDIERHRGDAKLVVMPPPCPLAISPIDFGKAGELIERAHADACEFLDSGGADRPPIRMHMHRHAATRSAAAGSARKRAASVRRALPGAPRPAPAAAPPRRAT